MCVCVCVVYRNKSVKMYASKKRQFFKEKKIVLVFLWVNQKNILVDLNKISASLD